MESRPECEPCAAQDKSSLAVTLCSDCDEKLCGDCVDHHSKFKAFRSHHLIDLSKTGSMLPSLAKHCDLHEESPLDFYCSEHCVVCCRSCIPLNHQTCKDVLPIEVASRDIKDSAILQDVLEDMDNVLKSLTYLMENRNNNMTKIMSCEPVILTQVQKVKELIMKQIDKLEEIVIKELSSMMQSHKETLIEDKNDLARIKSDVLESKDQITFLREHGSNNQLFLAIHQQENKLQAVESRVEKMFVTFYDTQFTFNAEKDLQIESIGSVTQTRTSCQIKHKPLKLKQAQTNPESVKPITRLKKESDLKLKNGYDYNLTDIVVTNKNEVLLCNFSDADKDLYIYSNWGGYETRISFSSRPYGVTVLPKDDMALVTLPEENNFQYVNLKAATTGNKIGTAEACYAVCTNRRNIFLGGIGNVYILDLEGSVLRKIITQYLEKMYSICFSANSQQVICRNRQRLLGLNLAGDVVYTRNVNGETGLALDTEGNVYYSDHTLDEILRLSSDGKNKFGNDKVKSPCAIAFNKSFSKLFMISRFKSVHIYSCC